MEEGPGRLAYPTWCTVRPHHLVSVANKVHLRDSRVWVRVCCGVLGGKNHLSGPSVNDPGPKCVCAKQSSMVRLHTDCPCDGTMS